MNIINSGAARLVAIQVLGDNDSQHPGQVMVTIECNPSNAGMGIFNMYDQQIADVTIELYQGKLVARIWNKEDIGGDPTSRVELCTLEDLTKKEKV